MRNIFGGISIALALMATNAQSAIIISGVSDGTDTGGNPKSIEIVATQNIASLADFFILRDTNGSADGVFTPSDDFQLPDVALAAGEFFYIYGNADSQTTLQGFGFGSVDSGTGVVDGIANINGDDILALSSSTDAVGVIDAFGLLGQGDTDFYANSFAYRQPGVLANASGVQDAGNFDITPYDAAAFQQTFGTFQVTAIPEPSSMLVLGAIGFAGTLGARRRRKTIA